MAIEFTQYMLPNGRTKTVHIERPAEIEAAAERFIDAGGKYECEILTTGHVSLTAQFNTPEDGPQDVEIELVNNGPGVGEAVDRLVTKSLKHIKAA